MKKEEIKTVEEFTIEASDYHADQAAAAEKSPLFEMLGILTEARKAVNEIVRHLPRDEREALVRNALLVVGLAPTERNKRRFISNGAQPAPRG